MYKRESILKLRKMKIVVETSGKYGSRLVKQDIPEFSSNDTEADFDFEVVYVNTEYLREYGSLSPSLAWRALRYGWSTLDELRQKDPKITDGQVYITVNGDVLSYGKGSREVHRASYGNTYIEGVVPTAFLRWSGGNFLGHCDLTGRRYVDPYTIEFKESMLLEPKTKIGKWYF